MKYSISQEYIYENIYIYCVFKPVKFITLSFGVDPCELELQDWPFVRTKLWRR